MQCPGGPQPPLGAPGPFTDPLLCENLLKMAKTPIFLPSAHNNSAPWWPNQKTTKHVCPAWPKDHSCQVSSKSVDVQGNIFQENIRTEGNPLQNKGRFATILGGLRPPCMGRGASPPLGGRFATSLLRPNRPEKGNHLASLSG